MPGSSSLTIDSKVESKQRSSTLTTARIVKHKDRAERISNESSLLWPLVARKALCIWSKSQGVVRLAGVIIVH